MAAVWVAAASRPGRGRRALPGVDAGPRRGARPRRRGHGADDHEHGPAVRRRRRAPRRPDARELRGAGGDRARGARATVGPGRRAGLRRTASARRRRRRAVLDPAPLVARVVAERDRGTPVARVAAGFHEAIGRAAADLGASTRGRARGLDAVALTGGVFQNVRLTEVVEDALLARRPARAGPRTRSRRTTAASASARPPSPPSPRSDAPQADQISRRPSENTTQRGGAAPRPMPQLTPPRRPSSSTSAGRASVVRRRAAGAASSPRFIARHGARNGAALAVRPLRRRLEPDGSGRASPAPPARAGSARQLASRSRYARTTVRRNAQRSRRSSVWCTPTTSACQLDLLPRPARHDAGARRGQLVGVGELVHDAVVAQPEPARRRRPPGPGRCGRGSALGAPSRAASSRSGRSGSGTRDVDVGLDPHRREPVDGRRPPPRTLRARRPPGLRAAPRARRPPTRGARRSPGPRPTCPGSSGRPALPRIARSSAAGAWVPRPARAPGAPSRAQIPGPPAPGEPGAVARRDHVRRTRHCAATQCRRVGPVKRCKRHSFTDSECRGVGRTMALHAPRSTSGRHARDDDRSPS